LDKREKKWEKGGALERVAPGLSVGIREGRVKYFLEPTDASAGDLKAE